jgi:undecaprenyl-diphosphatase
MHILEAIILGLTQGLTEFIPVSSSAHLIIINRVFGLEVGGFVLDAMLNIGTTTALLIYFRKYLLGLLRGILAKDKQAQKLGASIIIATLPAVVIGYFLQDLADGGLRSIAVVTISLALVGVMMLLADRTNGTKKLNEIDIKTGFYIGLAQAAALIPGVSRSGSTIVAARAMHFNRETAAQFSFLLAIPILIAAMFKVIISEGAIEQITADFTLLIVGNLASFISGYVAIRFLLKYLKQNSLSIFAWYRIGLASVIALSFVLG